MEAIAEWFKELPIALNFVFFAVGVALITKGASWLTDSAVVVAERLRVPKVIIGATIVSVMTTFPEFAVSMSGALLGEPDTAVGNVIGSTICNIGLILGLSILIRAAASDKRLVREQGGFMLVAGVLVLGFALTGGMGKGAAAVFLVGFAAYIAYSLRAAMKARAESAARLEAFEEVEGIEEQVKQAPVGRQIGLLLFGGVLVGAGSQLLVMNAIVIAEAFGVPKLVISLTLVALGTSLPELVTAVTAAWKGHGDLSVGNILGANILDIFWVLGSCGLVINLPARFQTKILDGPVMLLLMGLLVFFGATKGRLGKKQGIVFLGIYVAYLVLMFVFFMKPPAA